MAVVSQVGNFRVPAAILASYAIFSIYLLLPLLVIWWQDEIHEH